MPFNRAIQFVVKISKLCNLRCAYCYEYNELGVPGEISAEDLTRFFENIKGHIAEHRPRVEFIWHGGEPFLVDLKKYLEIKEMQGQILPGSSTVTNAVQTNLTVLSDQHVEFLEQHRFFDGVGVSFDVFGDQRVNISGDLQTEKVLKNLQTLFDHGIRFGAITVLAQNTLAHVRRIYRFYDSMNVSCRFLPIYRNANELQLETHALSGKQIEESFIQLYEDWTRSTQATPVEPIHEYLDYALSFLKGESGKTRHYNKRFDEQVFIVNKDGMVWGVSETYDPKYQYGNIFQEDLSSILESPGRQLALAEAEERIERFCSGCQYFGHCPGSFVGDATPQQLQQVVADGCTVRNVLNHLVHSLKSQNVLDQMATLSEVASSESMSGATGHTALL
jgi:uncharacterized protein